MAPKTSGSACSVRKAEELAAEAMKAGRQVDLDWAGRPPRRTEESGQEVPLGGHGA